MNETEIIQGARELLSDPKRWNKGDLTNRDGTKMCVVGAMLRASNIFWENDCFKAAATLIRQHIPNGRVDLADDGLPLLGGYNDHPDTTHQDVLDVLDKTLADLGGLA